MVIHKKLFWGFPKSLHNALFILERNVNCNDIIVRRYPQFFNQQYFPFDIKLQHFITCMNTSSNDISFVILHEHLGFIFETNVFTNIIFEQCTLQQKRSKIIIHSNIIANLAYAHHSLSPNFLHHYLFFDIFV